jgi:transcriptional regulator with XRE-family HTH domain
MTLGQVICELRSGMGMSQGRLAGELNKVSGRITLTREDVSRWERGKRMPGPFRLPHLSIALQIPLAQLESAKIGRGPLDSRADDIWGLMAWVADSNTTDAAIEQIAQAVAYLVESHSQIPQQIVLAGVCKLTRK